MCVVVQLCYEWSPSLSFSLPHITGLSYCRHIALVKTSVSHLIKTRVCQEQGEVSFEESSKPDPMREAGLGDELWEEFLRKRDVRSRREREREREREEERNHCRIIIIIIGIYTYKYTSTVHVCMHVCAKYTLLCTETCFCIYTHMYMYMYHCSPFHNIQVHVHVIVQAQS